MPFHEAQRKGRDKPAIRKTLGWLIDFNEKGIMVAGTDDAAFEGEDYVAEITFVPFGMIMMIETLAVKSRFNDRLSEDDLKDLRLAPLERLEDAPTRANRGAQRPAGKA